MFRAPSTDAFSPSLLSASALLGGSFRRPAESLGRLGHMKGRASNHYLMEHRWGRRIAGWQTLKLQSARYLGALGLLLSASLSGAYVATSTAVARDERIILQLHSPTWLSLSGFVVRTDESGFGLEWEEFASDPVRALLLSMNRRT
jgi:hypothetical protein